MYPLCILTIKGILQEKIKNPYALKSINISSMHLGFRVLMEEKIFPLIQENIGPEVREVFK